MIGKTVDGGWTDWGNWSTCECDHSTGTGTWNRTRSCTNPTPFCYGRFAFTLENLNLHVAMI